MAWQHPTEYRHYLRKYPQGDTTFDEIDIEETFKCRFQKMSNATQTDVKNIYEESYAEKSGSRLFCPPVDDLAYNTSEIALYLRWRSDECDDVLYWSDKFFKYITGQRFEYHDTFRPNRYWQFVMEKAPSAETDTPQYLIIKYTLKNWAGEFFETSQL